MIKTKTKINYLRKGIETAGLFIVVLLLLLNQSYAFNAYEAHIVNVKAIIVNDIPQLDPPGGDYCIDDILLGSFDIPDIEGAYIWYTVGPGGEEPICDDTGHGYLYDDEETTFGINHTSNIVKARTCHDGKQSAVMTWIFNFSIEYCNYICGNGLLEGNEECDDGNNNDWDGCSSSCQLEQFYCNPEQELVINGGFEEPVVDTSQNWNIFVTPDVPGWNIEWMSLTPSEYGGYTRPADANLELHRGVNNWVSYEGEQYAELDTDWYGPGDSQNNEPASVKIYQDIPTIPGFTYDINFVFSPRPNTNEANNNLEFSWDEAQIDTFSGAGLSNTVWSEHNYSFVANNNTTRIQFADLGTADSLGTFLDAVSVKCVPPSEPVCGNGIVETGEECDDGNNDDGDGCSCICETEEQEPEFDTCMKINEVYYDVDNEYGDEGDEWIELYNACEYIVNLQNWYLEDNNSTEDIHENHPLGPGEFIVIAANASTWSYWPDIPNNAFKIALGGNEMFNGLANTGDRVFLYNNNHNLIDTVSWGTDISAFNPSVPDVAEGHSISRITAGYDTDTADDWMDTYSGSDPAGPNPGTNPHESTVQNNPPATINNSEEGNEENLE